MGGKTPGQGNGGDGASKGGGSDGGSSADSGPPGPPGPPGTGGSNADASHCVEAINAYRAQAGLPALTESASIDTFSADGAASDSQTGKAHGHFIATQGGHGVSFAENEIPGWPKADYGGVAGVIDAGTKMMWNEGPGGGHHDNIANPSYREVGCGVTVTSDGLVWVTSDFR